MTQPTDTDLHLRPYRAADADRLAVLLNDPDVTAMTGSIPYPYALADAQAYVAALDGESGRTVNRAIVRHTEGADELLGGIGLAVRAGVQEELGYWVGKPFWRQGIGTRAVALFLAELAYLNISGPIRAQTLQDNIASQRVLLANGFVPEGEGECMTPAREVASRPSYRYVLENLKCLEAGQ